MSKTTLTFSFDTENDALAFLQRCAPAEAKPSTKAEKPQDAKVEKPAVAAKATIDAKPATPAVAYPDLQKAVFALAGKVKGLGLSTDEHVLAIAKGLGADTFKSLAPEQFGEALALVNAKLAEVSAQEAVA